MSGSQIKKIVIDTNIIFMSWYNPFGKCADVLRAANEGKIELFAPDSVREEIIRALKKHNILQEEIQEFLRNLPINWIERDIYENLLDRTKVKHKADKPVESVSLMLDCGILSADHNFKDRVDVNKLLEELKC